MPPSPSHAFTGTFDGLGHSISNLTINQTDRYVGLFGSVGSTGVVQNVGLVGGSVTGDNATGALVDASVRPAGSRRRQASATAVTSFCRVSLASPKSMVVFGS